MEKESGYCDLGPCEGSGSGNSTTVIVMSTTDGSIRIVCISLAEAWKLTLFQE